MRTTHLHRPYVLFQYPPEVRGFPRPMYRGELYSEVLCIMRNGHMGDPFGQTHTCENIIPEALWK